MKSRLFHAVVLMGAQLACSRQIDTYDPVPTIDAGPSTDDATRPIVDAGADTSTDEFADAGDASDASDAMVMDAEDDAYSHGDADDGWPTTK